MKNHGDDTPDRIKRVESIVVRPQQTIIHAEPNIG
jgi:hypothetical protein